MKKWYYKIEEKEFGAITQEELVNLIESGELSTNTLVRDEDMDFWVKASSINGLLPIFKEKSKKYTSIGKYIFFLLFSSSWFIYDGVPYVPFGFILTMLLIRVKNWKLYVPLILVLIIGFIGTGGYVALSIEKRTMLKTGKTHNFYKFGLGIRYGTYTLDYLRNRGKVVIYKDKRVANQVAKATKVMEQFVESYNRNSPDFLIKSFSPQVDEQKLEAFLREAHNIDGNINSFAYMGDVMYQQKQPVFAVFYKIKTQKDKSRVIRLLFNVSEDRKSISFINVRFIPKDIEFRVIEI